MSFTHGFLGMKSLERALASLPNIKFEERWQPFQLDPTVMPEGKEHKAYMLAQFSDEASLAIGPRQFGLTWHESREFLFISTRYQ